MKKKKKNKSNARSFFKPLLVVMTVFGIIGLISMLTTFATGFVVYSPSDPDYPQKVDFVAVCSFVKTANDDPIVFPGQPGAAHNHTFGGGTNINAYSTPWSLYTGGTSCGISRDLSQYWTPTLYADGVPLIPNQIRAYYRAGTNDGPSVQPIPFGLRVIAGNAAATSAQPANIAGFQCRNETVGNVIPKQSAIPNCPADTFLEPSIIFPNCWDGKNLDSPDHKSHLTYGPRKAPFGCPSTHPVQLSQLTVALRYPVGATYSKKVTIASKLPQSEYTLHSDFMNAWDPAFMKEATLKCINASIACETLLDNRLPAGFSARITPASELPPEGTTVSTTPPPVSPTPTPAPAPTIQFFRPLVASIVQGNYATFEWSATDASYCTMAPGSGVQKPAISSEQTQPLNTLGVNTFSLSCTGTGGTRTASSSVSVTAPVVVQPQITSLTANPTTVTANMSSTLSWTTTDANACSLNYNGTTLSTLPANGSTVTAPLATNTTATLSCTSSSGGSVSKAITIAVATTAPAPVPAITSFTVSPTTVKYGQRVTLKWAAISVNTCRIAESSVTSFPISGSYTMKARTSSFTLTCRNPGQSVSKTVSIKLTSQGQTTLKTFATLVSNTLPIVGGEIR